MQKSKLQFWLINILVIVGIIYISSKISFLFEPIFIFASTLFFPILISGFLFFILNPILRFAEKYKVPRTLGILLLYILVIGLITLVISWIGPTLTEQVGDLVKDIPKFADKVIIFINNFAGSPMYDWIMTQDYVDLKELGTTIADYLSGLPKAVSNSITGLLGVVANVALTIAVVPFLLFYMLKDGHKLPKAILRFLPTHFRDEGLTILNDTTKTLSAYIQGQMIVSLCVGTLSYIGYIIIDHFFDLPYALFLALLVAVTNIIPYLGPFLGAAPAVIVALFHSPMTALFTILVAVVAQQIESNVISPLVIGKSLDTHPATIIIILLVAGNLAGVIGMILAVPVYAVSKTFILNVVRMIRLYRLHKNSTINENNIKLE